MTYFVGLGLLIAGVAAANLYPVNRLGVPLIIAGALVVVLRAFGAVAADLPVPPPGVTPAQMRSAIADQERRRRAPRRKFEDMLMSPIGKGRME